MNYLFRSLLPVAGLFLLATPVLAQPCASNFKVDGVPMVTGLSYRTWDLISRPPAAVLKDLAAAVSAEGFADMRIDRQTSAVVAIQETSGSGRPQTLRITARKSGKGTRVDAVFVVQAGQVAPEDYVRKAFCRVIGGARG
ncbi:MAG: hypothetical protein ACTHP8_18635 [Bosea sp. (in: a-proteobacteria)]|uniref:hypothetical protein n=1 Tax=Bosea sp. (in: a-proteobacteria) TaxID=1871050 RepID=UPI003F7BB627